MMANGERGGRLCAVALVATWAVLVPGGCSESGADGPDGKADGGAAKDSGPADPGASSGSGSSGDADGGARGGGPETSGAADSGDGAGTSRGDDVTDTASAGDGGDTEQQNDGGSSGGDSSNGGSSSGGSSGGDADAAGDVQVPKDTANCKKERCNGKDDDCDGLTDEDTCVADTACKVSVCDPGLEVCLDEVKADGTACDNGQACNGPDYCQGGVCLPGPATDCNDGSPCTNDSCNKELNKCFNLPLADGSACDDGSACTKGEACKAGACVPASKVDCDDANACTLDSCHLAQGCAHLGDDGAKCTDGDVCTENDACKAGVCEAGGAKKCPEGKVCETVKCDAKTGGCSIVKTPEGGPCQDGDPCTEGKTCSSSGSCTGGKPKDCDDGNPCTKDTCIAASGGNCLHLAIPDEQACDDGDKCTTGDTCKNHHCVTQPRSCADGNPCTDDLCDKAAGCVFANNTKYCEDGSKCTRKDRCKAGKCRAGEAVDCDDGNDCTVDACNQLNGTCNHDKFKLDGKPCDADASACTAGDQCSIGTCVLGKKKDCGDAKPCTADLCDPKTAACTHPAKKAGEACNDGSYCTLSDTCDAAGKCSGKPLPCNDHNGCTRDGCDSKTGACTFTQIKVGQPCDDEDACTTGDVCNSQLQCQPGKKKNCDDNEKCSKDGCDPKTGQCTHVNAPGGCEDGSMCTLSEHCVDGKCGAGEDGWVVNYAGSGSSGSVVGPRLSASFRYPADVAVAADGTVYVADRNGYRIQKIDPKGIVTNFVGSGSYDSSPDDGKGTLARLGRVYGLAIDRKSGNLWFAENSASTIRRITPDGMVKTIAGWTNSRTFKNGVGLNARFYYPRGVAVGPGGMVLVADANNHRIRRMTAAGVVTTFAGSGAAGFADGNAASARFYYPHGVASDPDGVVYVADYQNHRVRRITPKGMVTTIAGTGAAAFADGPGKLAAFRYPEDIEWSPAGYLLVADRQNHRIRKVTVLGQVSTFSGSGAAGFADGAPMQAHYYYPYGLGVGPLGRVFVADSSNYRIRMVKIAKVVCDDRNACTKDSCDPKAGCKHLALSAGDPCSDDSKCMTGGTCDKAGKCTGKPKTCSDSNSCTTDSCDPVTGACIYTFVNASCDDGDPCTEGERCTVGTCMVTKGLVTTFTGNGAGTIKDGIGTSASHYYPRGIARDGKGAVYVAESNGRRIRRVDEKTGAVKTFAGSGASGWKDGPAASAVFNYPTDVVVAANGDVYVADRNNHRIRRISGGTVSTLAGSGTSSFRNGVGTSAFFYYPEGLAMAKDGQTLYVADSYNNRIRKIDAQRRVSTFMGTGSTSYSDGGLGQATFYRPGDVAVGDKGEVYVADTYHHKIRVITGGQTHLLAGTSSGWSDGGPGDARFYYPGGLDYHAGRLYVADRANHVIRVVEHDGRTWTIAGIHGSAGWADGDSLSQARFSSPYAVLWTPGGLLVSDYGNQRLRRLLPLARDCDDSDPCTTDSCDAKTGKCVNAAISGCCVPELLNAGFEASSEALKMTFTDCPSGIQYHEPVDSKCSKVSGATNSKGWQVWPSASDKKSGNGALYYGYPPSKSYAFGIPHAGYARTPPVRIPPGTTTKLSFSILFDTPTGALYDQLFVWLVADGQRLKLGNAGAPEFGSIWYRGGSTNTPNKWYDIQLDVSKYAGKKLQLEAYFNTARTPPSGHKGVFVDDVKIVRACPK